MSPMRVTMRRTIGRLINRYSTMFIFAGFLAAAGALFAFNLSASEGSEASLTAIWAVSASAFLPVLVALLGMDVWSGERDSGRIELLLSAPVREREYTLGKFLGVWLLALAAIAAFLFSTLVAVSVFAPPLVAGLSFASFVPAMLALALQGMLWSALAVAVSALCRNSIVSAIASITLFAALPRVFWMALMEWAPQGRSVFGELPLDAHIYDMSLGLVSTGAIVGYIVFSIAALAMSSKFVFLLRLHGKGAKGQRALAVLAAALAAVLAVMVVTLAMRLGITLDLPSVSLRETRFSARTRNILAEARGEITITAFVSRKDPRFRPLSHFLRALADEATASGGARVQLRYVDPKWDLGAAGRLVRAGVAEESLVFERARRREVLPLANGYGERLCASAIMKVAMPPQRRSVYWTGGHGEVSFEQYGNWGMSDIARDLARDGYRNLSIDLAGEAQVPSDCALIVVAGPKDEFSRVEIGRLDAYLKQGGRLLVLLGAPRAGGLETMLSGWGMRPAAASLPAVRTLSGSDALVSDFGEHSISAALVGSQIVLEKPVAFMPSAAAQSADGADCIKFAPLASIGEVCVAALSERGGEAGKDLAIRPTRIVAIGDESFVMNGQLGARANANRDFFLNAVAYLSGTAAVAEEGGGGNKLVSGMDRAERARFAGVVTGALPAVLLAVLLAFVCARRRRR